MDAMNNAGRVIPVSIQLSSNSTSGKQNQPAPTLFEDPICHMLVERESAADSVVFQGNTYYFCNINCSAKFSRSPGRYIAITHESNSDQVN